MSSSAFSNFDVDELFVKHTIAEIEEIQKKLESESERKREELRTMVGERYRDLLEAADTIMTMKQTAACLIEDVENITINCKKLNEKQLLGLQSDTPLKQTLDRETQTYYATVFQIKLLIELPELIWTQIDDENFFVATQLFILARHISTGLQLDVGNNVIQHFPVAKKQWTVLKPFFFTIKQSAIAALEKDSLTPEAATNCLLSLFLLEQSSMDSILTNFLQIRAKAYLAALSSDKSAHKRVKERILSSLEVLNSTVVLIFRCFVDIGNGNGLVVENLEKLASRDSQPTISLMNLDETDQIYELPDIIAKFKPTFELPSITSSTLNAVKSIWLQTISKIIENQLKGLFELVTSMKTIQEIKNQSLRLPKVDNWTSMCEKLGLDPHMDFYQHYYRPLINCRVREIVRQSWSKAMLSTYEQIESFLKPFSAGKQFEHVATFLWKENVNDIPVSLKQALQQDRKSNRLLMKSKGYSDSIVEICAAFDNRLKIIISEIGVLLDEDGSVGHNEEKQAMVEFVKNTSEEYVAELITKVKSLQYDGRQENFISLARLFTAFTNLCPNLKTCLSYSLVASSWDQISTDKSNYEKWNRILSLFEDEAFALWRKFCEVFLKEFGPERIISKDVGIETILSDLTIWESINIEVKDEHDNLVQSVIRVPSQPRMSMQLYFFKLIQALSNSVPETLPRKVLIYLNSLLSVEILRLYANYVDNDFVKTNQNAALQLYFDLKFFQTVFLARNDKKAQDEVQRLTNCLKNFVDPFDFELFHSYLNTNVRKCIQRLQHALDVLIPYPENVTVLVDQQKPTIATHDRDPNVLCLSSNGASATWFPLLPIIVSGSKIGSISSETMDKNAQSKAKKQSDSRQQMHLSSSSTTLATAQQTAQNYASNVKSGAAAFFGAMSQDWFR